MSMRREIRAIGGGAMVRPGPALILLALLLTRPWGPAGRCAPGHSGGFQTGTWERRLAGAVFAAISV